MAGTLVDDFILFGSTEEGGRFYVATPAAGRNVWTAYDVGQGGQLANPRVVFGGHGWRGLPALDPAAEELP